MGIAVSCPNGHHFKVKDKYAGKKGLCPYCQGQVAVRVPASGNDHSLQDAAYRVAAEEHGAGAAAAAAASIFDDHGDTHDDPTASASLMGSSVIRHNIKCVCGKRVPMWFAKCPDCGHFLDHR